MQVIHSAIYFIGLLTGLGVITYALLQIILVVCVYKWSKQREDKNRELILKILLVREKINSVEFHNLCKEEEKIQKEEIKRSSFVYARHVLNKNNDSLLKKVVDQSNVSSCLRQLKEEGLVREKSPFWHLEDCFYYLTERGKVLANQFVD
jgi:uncharacterized membrane protein YhiD involved in acid resistance